MSKTIEEQFVESIHQLKGKECWSITGGPSTGLAVQMKLGNKIPRKKRLEGKYLTEDEKNFDGELVIYVHTFWRIDSQSEVLIGCYDEDGYQQNGPTFAVLNQIIGRRIIDVSCSPPGFDLNILFNNGLIFRVFCMETNTKEDENIFNYEFCTAGQDFVVGLKSKISSEPRSL